MITPKQFKIFQLRIFVIGVGLMLGQVASAQIDKADNTDNLNLASSWMGGNLPSNTDVVRWNSTVTAATTVNLGSNLSWEGIAIADPGGLVNIRFGTGQTLTLGSQGIDMSTATQNLSLMTAATANTAGTLSINGNQTWNVTSGRTLTMFSTSNTANQRLAGSGNITVTGGGLVNLNVGDQGSTTFVAGNGNDTYNGNWLITGGSKVSSLRNGTHGWGQGTITLDNGTMSQQQGNWSYSNNITVGTGGGTIFSDSTGNARYMNLTGVISGNGALTFDAIAAMTTNEGFILTGASTFNGPMTINANATVRIGGNATTSINGTQAGTLGSIDSSVAITNNGILGFGRTDAHTFSNNISGTGIVRMGRTGGVLPATQVVTLAGANTYTGDTQVNAGRLNLTGSFTSNIVVASDARVSGNGSTTGSLTLNSGAGILLDGGATTTALIANGASFGGSNLVTFARSPIASTIYDVFTYGSGSVLGIGNLSVGWRGSLSDDVANQKYVFTAGASGTRTWNTTSGTWDQGITANFVEGDQLFFGGDNVVFNDPGSLSLVSLSGRLAPALVTVNNNVGNDYTFSGLDGISDITGTGSLVKNGSGKLLIDSGHTYTGTTTINQGVVEVGIGGTAGSLGSGAIDVAVGAELVFNRSNAFTVANSLAASGLITKRGAGRMSVTGNNSASVNHWRFNGTGNGDIGFLNASAIGATGSTIALDDDATGSTFFASGNNSTDVAISLGTGSVFTWNGSTGNTNTLSGVISGSGSFTKVSGEVLILTGNNNYAGATTVNAGVLQVGNGGTTGTLGTGMVVNNANLTFNRSDAITVANAISGTGSIVKSGAGTTKLTGSNTYSGNTNILAGKLIMNGQHLNGQQYTVQSGAYLGGTGSIDSNVVVNSKGVLEPGDNGFGALTIDGNLTLNGIYSWELMTSTSADVVGVYGNLDLQGLLSINLFPNLALEKYNKFTLFAYSGDLSGSFLNTLHGWEVNYMDKTPGINTFAGAGQFKYVTLTAAGQRERLYQMSEPHRLSNLTAVPEPSAILLVGSVGLLMLRSRRRK